MKIGSLFSGISGFDLGLERAGHEVVWQVEYDKQARSVLRRHWPNVDLHEDVRNVGAGELGSCDLIAFGSPCQGLSVAGRRKGLADERSGLFLEAIRIADEVAATWLLFENVPGLLSSESGEDFAVCLEGFVGWRPAVPEHRWRNAGFARGPLGTCAWRVLDSQFAGVAQRRRRVFVLACRDPRAGCPAEILAIPEGLSGHPAPSREAGARASAEPTIGTLAARDHKGVGTQYVNEGKAVAHTLRAEGHDASEDGTGRGVPLVADPICANEQRTYTHEGSTFRLRNVVPFRKAQKAHDADDCGRWEEAEHSNTLAGHGTTTSEAVVQSLAIRGRDGMPQAELGDDGKANALITPNGGRGGVGAGAVLATIPRRLTPVECCRLQGFPDDWNAWGVDEDGERVELADSPRYRQLGNAVTVNVAEWIGHRLATLATGFGEPLEVPA